VSVLKIASAQYPITEHKSLSDWQNHTARWVNQAVAQNAGLLIFPEYGSMELVSLFSDDIRRDIRYQVKALGDVHDQFLRTYEDLAKRHRVTIVAPSIPVEEGDRIVNRAYVFSANGLAGYQDKFFMTRFEDEEWGIESGEKVLTVFEADWGRFGIQICYDVEFPLGAALLAGNGAELILAPSCTETIRGATRVHTGARARALENQVYSIVSQTVGEALWSPAVDINYGFAAVYSTPDRFLPEEGILLSDTPQEVKWSITELDLTLLEKVRTEGQVFCFRDFQRLDIRYKDEPVQVQKIRL